MSWTCPARSLETLSLRNRNKRAGGFQSDLLKIRGPARKITRSARPPAVLLFFVSGKACDARAKEERERPIDRHGKAPELLADAACSAVPSNSPADRREPERVFLPAEDVPAIRGI